MVRRAIAAFRTALKVFRKSERGNVAMLFGIASIPLVVAVGGVIDFSRIYYARTNMQDALDATALALSKTAATTPPGILLKQAQDYFSANFNELAVMGFTVTPTYDPTGPKLTVEGDADVKMYFMGLVGFDVVPVHEASTVVWGETRLRISLVLDNTGSMAQAGKMAALKAASHTLLNQLKGAANKSGDVYVSIVPFSRDVTVDKASFNPSFLRWDLWEETNGVCSNGTSKNRTSCLTAKKVWTAADHAKWNGCITDRDQNYDTLNTAPSKDLVATQFPTDQYTACPTLMMGLSEDWLALNARVDMMQPNGLTNQSIGLQWGWQSLTAAPFTIPPKQAGVQYRDVVILLSDGLNTENRWSKSAKPIDDRESILCTNVKKAGIDIFTVQVNTDGDPTSALLRGCASDPSQFFLLTSADAIVKTFEQIGTQLTQLRVSS